MPSFGSAPGPYDSSAPLLSDPSLRLASFSFAAPLRHALASTIPLPDRLSAPHLDAASSAPSSPLLLSALLFCFSCSLLSPCDGSYGSYQYCAIGARSQARQSGA
ncbi:hypothetical protein NHX12_026760 [Muraenolepis orangiensis]|uniref:Uncharacterized protein n=1 Tax=Muraenolepis orangiensis TaxID=630683 RepID=A0A9Q0EKS9_9TELE|nr:hypothetical protein NHX12_026760 [Muraenolepis orangiensis]